MAARNNGWSRTKWKPANTSLALRRAVAGGGRRTGMVDSAATKTSCPTAASANAPVAPPVSAITRPPMAGPVIAANWKVDDSHALALANSAGASNCGRMVLTDGDANARAVPTSASSE